MKKDFTCQTSISTRQASTGKLKISTKMFVSLSLGALFLLGLLYFLTLNTSVNLSANPLDTNKDYINNKYDSDDPFITKRIRPDDIIKEPIISQNDPYQGDKYATVTIVEFSDFTCQFCQHQEQWLKEIVANNKGAVRLIWKDYPEADKESLSYKSALAARCAQVQNSFWPYHDFLYKFSNSLNEEKFFEIADIIKLDKSDFKKCYENSETSQLIANNVKEANALKISGIPFIFINDKQILGEVSYEKLEEIIMQEFSAVKK